MNKTTFMFIPYFMVNCNTDHVSRHVCCQLHDKGGHLHQSPELKPQKRWREVSFASGIGQHQEESEGKDPGERGGRGLYVFVIAHARLLHLVGSRTEDADSWYVELLILKMHF